MNRSDRPQQLRSDTFLKRAMDDWGGSVYRLALAQTGSRADAEDVYQDVFIKLAQNTTMFNGNEHLKAWLLRVTINRCHDLARSSHRHLTTALDDLPYEPQARDPLPHDFAHDVWEAVENLPDSLRPLVHLFYYEGYTTEGRMNALLNESLRAHLVSVEKLSKATFSVTATFTDGSIAVKRYCIAPVENFEEVFRNHDESSTGGLRYPDPLFTITELG